LRPIVGNTIVILYIERVVIIGEVGTIIDGILRHFPLFAACAVVVTEYGRFLVLLDAKEKRGLAQEKRKSLGAKAALQISLHRTEEKPRILPMAIQEEP